MNTYIVLVHNILNAYLLHFGICTYSMHLSMFHKERCYRNKIIIFINNCSCEEGSYRKKIIVIVSIFNCACEKPLCCPASVNHLHVSSGSFSPLLPLQIQSKGMLDYAGRRFLRFWPSQPFFFPRTVDLSNISEGDPFEFYV